jgi:membrane-associated phospholipid phosphatase
MSLSRANSADALRFDWRTSAAWSRALPLAWGAAGVGVLALLSLLDRPIALQLHGLRGTELVQVAVLVTKLGQAQWWLASSLLLFLSARFLWRSPTTAARALFVFASVASAGLASDVLKFICGRARPQLWFDHHIYGFSFFHFSAAYQSFPSGHAACALGAGLALTVILPRFRAWWVSGTLLIALTRVLLTVHYLSDVAAATALAFLTVLAMRSLFIRFGLALEPPARLARARVASPAAARLVGVPVPEHEPLPAPLPRYRPLRHPAIERAAAANEC